MRVVFEVKRQGIRAGGGSCGNRPWWHCRTAYIAVLPVGRRHLRPAMCYRNQRYTCSCPMGGSLEAIRYSHADGRAALSLLEQRALPQNTEWVDIDGPNASWSAIKEMTVRGAPAIGVRRQPPLQANCWHTRAARHACTPTSACQGLHSGCCMPLTCSHRGGAEPCRRSR
jgi:hypothetical protein